jgi:hypothetical protein
MNRNNINRVFIKKNNKEIETDGRTKVKMGVLFSKPFFFFLDYFLLNKL